MLDKVLPFHFASLASFCFCSLVVLNSILVFSPVVLGMSLGTVAIFLLVIISSSMAVVLRCMYKVAPSVEAVNPSASKLLSVRSAYALAYGARSASRKRIGAMGSWAHRTASQPEYTTIGQRRNNNT